jgi:hypothetical protein
MNLLGRVGRNLRRKLPEVQAPRRNSVVNLVHKVRITGVLIDSKPKYHCHVLTEEKLDEIRAQREHLPLSLLSALHKKWEVLKRDCENCYKIIETAV